MSKLIGTAPNQVPSNADLGTMAYQNSESVTVDNLTVTGDFYSGDQQYLFVQKRAEASHTPYGGIITFVREQEHKNTGFFSDNSFKNIIATPYTGSSSASIDSGVTFVKGGRKVILQKQLTFYQHSLSVPYDLSTLNTTAEYSFNLSSWAGTPNTYGAGVTFVKGGKWAWYSSGEYCYTIHSNQSTYSLYELSTPYDISTQSFVKHVTMSGVTNDGQGCSAIEFNNTGTKAYFGRRGGTDAYKIFQYELGKPFELDSALASPSVYTSSTRYDHIAVRIEKNGTYMYTGNHSPDVILQYHLSTPWDITTAREVQGLTLAQDAAHNGLFISEPGYY